MNKYEAITKFWNGFGLEAYDENSVPNGAKEPYITFNVVDSDFDNPSVTMNASIWQNTTTWKFLDAKSLEISKFISEMSPIKVDNGYLYITKGSPFAQRFKDELSDDYRILLMVNVEYITEY